jgi:hypothetical protein
MNSQATRLSERRCADRFEPPVFSSVDVLVAVTRLALPQLRLALPVPWVEEGEPDVGSPSRL